MHLLIRLHIFLSLSTEPIYEVFIHVVTTADLVKHQWCAAIGQTAFYWPPQLGAVRELSCKVDRTCSGGQDWTMSSVSILASAPCGKIFHTADSPKVTVAIDTCTIADQQDQERKGQLREPSISKHMKIKLKTQEKEVHLNMVDYRKHICNR